MLSKCSVYNSISGCVGEMDFFWDRHSLSAREILTIKEVEVEAWRLDSGCIR